MSMPVIFFGHGDPINAIELNKFTREWLHISKFIPKPVAILSISAHWETKGVFLTNNIKQRTIHDFGPISYELFNTQYSPQGSENLVRRVQELIPESQPDPDWGLDHGTWSILNQIFPQADIPTIQLSIDKSKSLIQHYSLARSLRQLREEGVLIMGSGNIVHNLRRIVWDNNAKPYNWALDFNNEIKNAILNRDHEKIVNFYKIPGAIESAPTHEHLVPLLYVLAQQKDSDKPILFADDFAYGSISMTSVILI